MGPSGDVGADVVLVEDSRDLAALYARWLTETHRVHVAHDCATAYELLDETVDVALLDRNLPDGTGGDVLDHVREADYDCRVAMVTAVQPGFDIIEMGFDDYLCKPATKAELEETVDRLLALAGYDEAVQALFALTSKKALLEAERPPDELAASEEYAALERRIEERTRELDALMERFSEQQFAAEYAQLGDRASGD